MANNEFVDKKLSGLREPEGFEPDAGRARMELSHRSAPRKRKWILMAAAAALLVVILIPAPRAVAKMAEGQPVSIHEYFMPLHQFLLAHMAMLVNHVHGSVQMTVVDHAGDLQPAPDFGGVRISDYNGKVLLLNVWPASCAECKRQSTWFDSMERDDLVVLDVDAGLELPEEYRASGPVTVIIDREGRIAGRLLAIPSKAALQDRIQGL